MATRKLRTFSKPVAQPLLSKALRDNATSVYALINDIDRAKDWKGRTNLAYQAAGAKPTFSRYAAGFGLRFDGGDECYSSVTAVTGPPAWIAGTFTLGSDITTVQVMASLGSSNPTFGAFLYIYVGTSTINAQIRWADSGTTVTITGPAAIASGVYHCAILSRSATDHVLWVNGQRFSSTSSASTGSSLVNMSIGCQRRAATSGFLTGTVNWAAYGTRNPGEKLLSELSVNPWGHLFEKGAIRATSFGDLVNFQQDMSCLYTPSRQPLVPIPY